MTNTIHKKYISHRGNLLGKSHNENQEEYILSAKNNGYEVEVDVWSYDGNYFLGHDFPQYKTSMDFLIQEGLWIHCKNIKALFLLKNKVNCFFHNIDDAVLTSQGHIWTYPGKELYETSIAVLPELINYSLDDLKKCAGVCSDFISSYKEKLI